jgi:hypothetical protein
MALGRNGRWPVASYRSQVNLEQDSMDPERQEERLVANKVPKVRTIRGPWSNLMLENKLSPNEIARLKAPSLCDRQQPRVSTPHRNNSGGATYGR